MAYPKRDWANTGNKVTKDDFKRIENGIEANDIEITKQKNPTIPGTLAKKIADNVTAIEENANKINVLNNDRGYLNTVLLPDGCDFNTVTKNGKYKIYNGLNAPWNGYFTFALDVTAESDNVLVQSATICFGTNEVNAFVRSRVGGNWQPWQQIATTKPAHLTVLNGWYMRNGFFRVEGNTAILSVELTNPSAQSGSHMFTFNDIKSTITYVDCVLYQKGDWSMESGNVTLTGDGVIWYGGTTNVSRVTIKLMFPIA